MDSTHDEQIDVANIEQERLISVYQIQSSKTAAVFMEVGEFEEKPYDVMMGSFQYPLAGKSVICVLTGSIYTEDQIKESQKQGHFPLYKLLVGDNDPFLAIHTVFKPGKKEDPISVTKFQEEPIKIYGTYSILAFHNDSFIKLGNLEEYPGTDEVVELMIGFLHNRKITGILQENM